MSEDAPNLSISIIVSYVLKVANIGPDMLKWHLTPFSFAALRHSLRPPPGIPRLWRGTRGDHGQDAHATAGEDGVFLIVLSATPRLCVTLLFPFSLPRLRTRGRVSVACHDAFFRSSHRGHSPGADVESPSLPHNSGEEDSILAGL